MLDVVREENGAATKSRYLIITYCYLYAYYCVTFVSVTTSVT